MNRLDPHRNMMEERLKKMDDDPATVARFCASVLDEFKLHDIKIFNVAEALQIADFFVIASGHSPRQVKAAADELLKRLREAGISRRGIEGTSDARWVLIDLRFVVIHLFLGEWRSFYDLENLWGDCPALPLEPATSRRHDADTGEGG